jgi:hypothetical protein
MRCINVRTSSAALVGAGFARWAGTGCDGQGRCETDEQNPVHLADFTNTKISLPRLTS